MDSNEPIQIRQLARPIKACLIFNPAAGTRSAEKLMPKIQELLEGDGWQVDYVVAQTIGDIGERAERAIEQNYQAVLIAGGDGSLSEAANRLAGTNTALGVIPCGTGNVWARQIGFPPSSLGNNERLLEACRLVLDGQIRTIDLGLAGGRHFLLWSGVGVDSEVSATIEPKPPRLRRLGMVGYGFHTVMVALRYRGAQITIQIDEKIIEAHAIVVVITNGPLYAAILEVAPKALLDDGLLDVGIFMGDNFFDTLYHFLNLWRGRAASNPKAILLRGKNIQIRSQDNHPVHIDAEPLAHTPICIQVVPRALRVIVPQTRNRSLFQHEPETQVVQHPEEIKRG